MAWNVSETFRTNCYDQTKRQRMLFKSDGVCLTNEDISVNGGSKFNLAYITSDQVTFGEMPTNSVNVALLNEDERISGDDIANEEFKCYAGVEVSDDDYYGSANAICAIHTKNESVSVHSVAPYVRGNISFGSLLPQLSNGWKCKIMFALDTIYFVVDHNSDRYYGKNERIDWFTFGNNQTPSDLEKNMLDRFADIYPNDSISYHEGGMSEYAVMETVQPTNTWGDLSSGTWNTVSAKKWTEYGGHTQMASVEYESVPYGVWKFERPRTVNNAVLNVNGKDRMVVFDEDSIDFANAMADSEVTVKQFIVLVAQYKGIPVGDLSGLNELANEIKVNPHHYYQGKSLKDLLSYAFEVGASNGFIDREGKLSAGSASMNALPVLYQYSVDMADYTAHILSSALIYKQGDLRIYQDFGEQSLPACPYEWDDNPFFNKTNPTGRWYSNGANWKYGGFRSAVVVSDADYSLWVDDRYVCVFGGNGYVQPIFTMQVEWNGSGKVTYTSSGDETRKFSSYDSRINATTSINDNNLDGLNKAQYANKLEFNEDGLTVYAKGLQIRNNANERVFYADDNGDLIITGTLNAVSGYFSGLLSATSGNIGNWEIVGDNLRCSNPNNAGENLFLGMGYGANPMDKTPLMKVTASTGVDALGATNYKHIVVCKDGIYFQTSKNTSQYASSVGGAFATGALGEEYLDVFASRRLNLRSSSGVVRLESGQNIECNKTINFESMPSSASSANAVLTYADSKYTLGISSSLRKYKDNIETIDNASEKVDSLRGVQFTSRCEADDPSKVYYGLIAEEVEEAVPELATYVNGELQSVQYDRVCALLIEDNKRMHQRIEELERRLVELERKVNK